ncbi:MAG TPA: hypothetical protein VGN86_16645 [Pyrinomonadaceae bacterium]|jgi:hypothetical protein|nr:hypothetical protein [Pyrinomonadaceae bacterium]
MSSSNPNKDRGVPRIPSLGRSVGTGAVGFACVSLIVFASVAYAERWMYFHLGLSGAYLTWTTLFILLGGGVLGSLVVGRWRLPRFFILFGIAFFAYAFGWTTAYFIFRGATGEWVGSLAGSVLMAAIFALGFRTATLIPRMSLILFVANSLGYFLGSAINNALSGRLGMLTWGVIYGLCLGAGLGAVLHLTQRTATLTLTLSQGERE